MEKRKLARKLASIAQIDFDAVIAYDEAVRCVDDADREVRRALRNFQKHHERHVRHIVQAIIGLGSSAPHMVQDPRGRNMALMTARRGRDGTRGALDALMANERLTNRTYSAAVSDIHFLLYPAEVRRLLEAHNAEEQHHLVYLESMLIVPAADKYSGDII